MCVKAAIDLATHLMTKVACTTSMTPARHALHLKICVAAMMPLRVLPELGLIRGCDDLAGYAQDPWISLHCLLPSLLLASSADALSKY
jgi:hypothetical protein